jgi:hypothetical protein
MEFFPPGALDSQPDGHAFRERWYVRHLLAMQELPLQPAAAGPDVYRLLFLPTFHQPSVIRLTHAEGVWRAVCKRSDGEGGYAPGRLAAETECELSPAEAKQFDRLLERAVFWKMPRFERAFGMDGSQAVLEGVRSGQYHVVDHWSPRGTPYARLVEFLLALGQAAP